MSEQKQDLLSEDRAIELAKQCREAMKGFGTNEKKLIEALCPLTAAQASQVVEAYKATINRDLVDDLKSELGGKLEDALVGIVSPPGLLLAKAIRKSVKGLGTDEELLVRSVCTITDDEEMQEAAKFFRMEFDSILADDVESDCGGKLKNLLMTVIRGAIAGRPTPDDSQLDEDVIRLYKAGEDKIGTNSGVFFDVLGGNSRAYVARVAEAYAKKHGKSLIKVIKDEFSGHVETGLIYLVQEPHVTFADLVYKSGKGLGTDEALMVNTIVSQRHRLMSMNQYFLQKHEKNIERFVKSELGGDLEDAMVAICKAFC